MRGHALIRWALPPALALMPAVARADDMADWLRNRAERFAALSAQNVNQPAEIAEIKAKTAARVAAAPARGMPDAAPVLWTIAARPVVILDDPVAPRMVVVPAGEFTMGEGERRQRVRIARPFAVSMFPIIYGEYAQFVAATGRKATGSCVTLEKGAFRKRGGRDWRTSGVLTAPRDPVACVSHDDANAYAAWLSRKTGRTYRLLSEAEYEYANRAGTASAFWWGEDMRDACTHANGYDRDAAPYDGAPARIDCGDGHATTAPVGVLKANGFGLFDTSGNVESWTADCWRGEGAPVPVDGAAVPAAPCRARVVRGGSWRSRDLRAASRAGAPAGQAASWRGFRIAREL